MKLEIKDLVCGFGTKTIVQRFNTTVESGQILCLLGPNGVGKSTLFRSILGLIKPLGGEVLIDGVDIHTLPRKEFARKMAYVPQAHNPPFPFRVLDVVMMGRTAHLGTFGAPGKHDREIALEMMDRLSIGFLADRVYTEISGGERQLVLIARALAQEPAFLMLDEPTSNLDFGNQVRVLQCVSKLAKDTGLGIIMTTHFPDHAFQCEGEVALMEWDNVFLAGAAEEIITAENMKDTYGIEIKVVKNDIDDLVIRSCVPVIRKP